VGVCGREVCASAARVALHTALLYCAPEHKEATRMVRVAALLVLALSLAGCDMISTLVDGFKYAKAVETDLEVSTGMKPEVGFDWHNGRLVTVTVTFPRIDEKRPLPELAETVRHAVANHFRQTPGDIVLGFSLGQSASGTVAQLRE
jgi:hypothetical protein